MMLTTRISNRPPAILIFLPNQVHMHRHPHQIVPQPHSKAMIFALIVAWMGSSFALTAAISKWMLQGQMPWTTLILSMLVMDVTWRIQSRKITL